VSAFRLHLFWFLFIVLVPGLHAGESRKLLITEIMALNSSGLKDRDGDYSDWIEIFNPASHPVDLTGWALTDNPEKPGKWKFPAMTLPVNGYLVVFASEKDRSVPGEELHTNFKLSGPGEYLALMEPDLQTVSFSFGAFFPVQQKDISYGIFQDRMVFFSRPTPGMENNPGDQVLAPVFSHSRGFYGTRFLVEISSPQPGLPVYYSTDGTRPDKATGKLYMQPVEITTTTPLSAVVVKDDQNTSEVVTHTYLFINNIIRQPDLPEGYPSQWGPYALKAGNAPADYGMDPEVCNHPDYREILPEALKSIPTVCFVTNPGFLFSHDTHPETGGIYIYTGDTNMGNLGEDWERPVSAEYIDPVRNTSFQINGGLQLHGGNSRKPENSQKHSFRLTFRSKYGPSKLNCRLFDDDGAANSFNSLVFRAGYNYSWVKNNATQRRRADYIRDPFAKNTQLSMGHLSAHNKFIHLYLNGLYWGLYNISEKITNDFMESYMGGKENDWDVVKDHSEVVDGNRDAWNRLISQANAGFSTIQAYHKVQGKNQDGLPDLQYENLLDMDNLIGYMIYNMYIGNNDWDHNNWIAGRNRVSPEYGFRFFCWDAEDALLDVNVNMTGENNNGNPSMLYTKLQQNEEFKIRFADHLQKHFSNGGALTPDSASMRYERLAREINLAIIGESARWGDYRKDVMPSDADRIVYTRNEHWLPEVEEMLKNYFPKRSSVVLNQFRSAGLFPNLDAPVFSHPGGKTGFPLVLSISAKAGEIYYTTDQSDPRATGGSIALPSAGVFKDPLILNGNVTVKARAKQGNTWSALTEAVFTGDGTGSTGIVRVGESNKVEVQVFPNPFNRFTTIEFSISETSALKACVYGTDGRLVETLANEPRPPGIHRLTWVPSGIPGGVYHYRIQLDNRVFTGKLLLIR
jgi:hypothetical protein